MNVIKNAVIITIECCHPDTSPEIFDVAVPKCTDVFNDNLFAQWQSDVLKTIATLVNRYYHTFVVSQTFYIEEEIVDIWGEFSYYELVEGKLF